MKDFKNKYRDWLYKQSSVFENAINVANDKLKEISKDMEHYENTGSNKPSKFWMVVGDGNIPKVRHENLESALRESKRLASENPGIEFFVVTATHRTMAEKVSVETL